MIKYLTFFCLVICVTGGAVNHTEIRKNLGSIFFGVTIFCVFLDLPEFSTKTKFIYEFNEIDYQSAITDDTSSIRHNLNFSLPFYGSQYNYTTVKCQISILKKLIFLFYSSFR